MLLYVIAFLDGAISSPNGAICISILLLVRKGAVKNGGTNEKIDALGTSLPDLIQSFIATSLISDLALLAKYI